MWQLDMQPSCSASGKSQKLSSKSTINNDMDSHQEPQVPILGAAGEVIKQR